MTSYSLKTAIATEPVSLSEAKLHLKIESAETTEDSLLAILITTAREEAEAFTRRALAPQTWYQYMDSFEEEEICLPYPPLTSVTSVKYYDVNNVLTTIDSSLYQVSTVSTPARIIPVAGQIWPETYYGKIDSVIVEFVCGYTSGVNVVPASIKAAMLLIIGHLYANKESVVVGTIASKVPDTAEALMWPYREIGW